MHTHEWPSTEASLLYQRDRLFRAGVANLQGVGPKFVAVTNQASSSS